GRSGRGISLGERQRLALARAVLSPAPLVVLDEPTAHLDGATEQVVLDLIAALRAAGRTVVVIAHRSALVDIADDVASVQPERAEALRCPPPPPPPCGGPSGPSRSPAPGCWPPCSPPARRSAPPSPSRRSPHTSSPVPGRCRRCWTSPSPWWPCGPWASPAARSA